MESKVRILSAIKANKPDVVDLPAIPMMEQGGSTGLLDTFRGIVEAIGGQVEEVQKEDISPAIRQRFPEAKHLASGTDLFQGTVPINDIKDPKALEHLDVFVCKGVLGVAENGAIWVPEHRIVHRVAPFITQHLVVLLNPNTIVADMHAAYEEIDIADEGFGVFIAGPSKTADIEQSLVLGAHGPRSMTVLLLQDS